MLGCLDVGRWHTGDPDIVGWQADEIVGMQVDDRCFTNANHDDVSMVIFNMEQSGFWTQQVLSIFGRIFSSEKSDHIQHIFV